MCGRAEEVEGPAVERWAATVAEEHGFTDIEHTVEVFGTCAQLPLTAVAVDTDNGFQYADRVSRRPAPAVSLRAAGLHQGGRWLWSRPGPRRRAR